MHITDAEMEILQTVWRSGRPLTTKEIMEQLPGKKQTTIITLAGRLIDKGILRSVKQGRTHKHLYSAVLSEQEYQRRQTQDFVQTVHKGSAKSLLSALFADEGLSTDDIAELQRFLAERSDDK